MIEKLHERPGMTRSNLTQLLIFEVDHNIDDVQSVDLVSSNNEAKLDDSSESESSETNMFDVVDETLDTIDDLTTENSKIDSFEKDD